ncbi:methyltransferase [Aurantiacibacter hainanensis]|uniref:methyltransferase n=1 Tax=Aurantiacibacter hainanensis TaxID=3076114 RepID=UPI0030C66088
MGQPIGESFDSLDDIFLWGNNVIFGTAAINAMLEGGVIAAILAGPASIEELASKCSLPVEPLERMMNFLLAHELIESRQDGRLQANDRTFRMEQAAAYFRHLSTSKIAGLGLLEALRTPGKTSFEISFGKPVFDYFNSNPKAAADFADFMGFMTRRIERFIFAHLRFEPFETVADIGGSNGDLLLGVLENYPGTNGILFDMPEVVAAARPRLEASPLAERVELVGGSFFERVPAADLYLLKQILHDWNDEECVTILRNIRAAIPISGRLAVIDHLLDDLPKPTESQNTDIAMLIYDSGRERKQSEFEALFAASGFKLDRITPNENGHSVIEAVPISDQ